MLDLLFYILAAGLVLLSGLAVSLPNLLHGAICLIGSFLMTAGLYIILQLEFVALSQVMLYIGGIVIFMLIIILLTTGLGAENRHKVTGYRRFTGLAVSFILLGGLLYTLFPGSSTFLDDNYQNAAPVTMDDIGYRLMSTSRDGFIVPFEIISLLLLVALVGAVVIARRESGKERQQ